MLNRVIQETLYIFNESAIYILFGLFLAGIIQVFVPFHWFKNALGKKGFGSVLKASLFGIPLPLCSCGVIPTAISLRKQGATKGATTSFLISTPQTGLDSIFLTYALLDPLMVILRPLISFATALVSGTWVDFWTRNEAESREAPAEASCHSCSAPVDEKPKHSLVQKIKEVFRYAFIDLIDDIGKLLLIGIVLAGVIGALIPDHFFEQYLHNPFIGMLIMMGVGIPLYVCAAASTPIAASLILKGISPGAAMVFLLVGPATNVATLVIIGKSLGRKAMIAYLGSLIILSLAMGIVINAIYAWMGTDATAIVGHHSGMLPPQVKMVGAILFAVTLLWQGIRFLKRKSSSRL